MPSRWHQLLKYWQGPAQRHALTLPFVLGADRVPIGTPFESQAQAKRALTILLDEVRNYQVDSGYFLIYRCPDRDKLVLRYVNGTPSSGSVLIFRSNGEQSCLVASDGSRLGASDCFNELLESIWSECADALVEGRFSCRAKVFVEYNEYEKAIIHKALA